jgi:hypothetical protein
MNHSLFNVAVNESSDVGIVVSWIRNGKSGISLTFMLCINDNLRLSGLIHDIKCSSG